MKNNELYYSTHSLMRDLGFVYTIGIVFQDRPPLRNRFKAVAQSGWESKRQI